MKHIKSEPRQDAIREEYLKPIYIDDATLGRFEFEREYNWYEGEIDWLGTELTGLANDWNEDSEDEEEVNYGS